LLPVALLVATYPSTWLHAVSFGAVTAGIVGARAARVVERRRLERGLAFCDVTTLPAARGLGASMVTAGRLDCAVADEFAKAKEITKVEAPREKIRE
jgi:hypothetical protein